MATDIERIEKIMGEIAEETMNGMRCRYCGCFIGDEVGYQRICYACKSGDDHFVNKVRCPECNKLVSPLGLNDHVLAKHG